MLFNSDIFLFAFLPLAVLGYYLLAHRQGVWSAKVWLCAASFVFYGWWNPAFLLLLTGSIAFNYLVSQQLTGTEERSGRQNVILTFGVVANLLLLFYYKYLFPLLGFLHHAGVTEADYGSVILPIGISFFTFTQIGYLVDCRQGLVRERGLLNYVLFVTFFPHLIAGPILHHKEIMPQFANEASYRFRADNLSIGLTVFALGLVKKVMLADSIAPWAEAGFDHPQGLAFLESWQVALAYSMQLYFDFSGYSDMAIGLGIMFGIRLPLNFNSPYKSSSIIEFWQRWHMTLTRYLTLLLYNPLALWVARRRQRAGQSSGKQAAATPLGFASLVMFPTVTTMFLAGLWHGAGLQFIIYGVLHAVYLSVNHAWRIFRKPPPKVPTGGWVVRTWSVVWPVVITYLAVLVAQIFFRANSVDDAVGLLAGMVGYHGSGFPLIVPPNNAALLGPLAQPLADLGVIAVGLRHAYDEITRPLAVGWSIDLALIAIVLCTPNVYQIVEKWSPALTSVKPSGWKWLKWQPSMAWALGIAVLMFLAAQRFDASARFLYFQF